jgi:hypothetical protein
MLLFMLVIIKLKATTMMEYTAEGQERSLGVQPLSLFSDTNWQKGVFESYLNTHPSMYSS